MTPEIKEKIIAPVQATLKPERIVRIGTGLIRIEDKGKEVMQSLDMLEYYDQHNCLEKYLTELTSPTT